MKSKTIKIGNQIIGDNYPVFIIAEAGVNHNGSLAIAKKLVDAAQAAGADAIKFQTFKAEDLTTPGAHCQMLKKLELSADSFRQIVEHCRRKRIMFLSTPFDMGSLEFLNQLGIPAFKISSGDLNNLPFLAEAARYGKLLILSTGMSDLSEVKEAVKKIYSTGNKKLVLLHCTSRYPAKYNEVNLRALDTLKRTFGLPVGYSDHTPGIEISLAAVALGAGVIEKHFTLDRKMAGPDHKASLGPNEFQALVESIRNIESARGDGRKKPFRSELSIQRIARKSIVAANDIAKGQVLSTDNLTIKRPGTGLPPKYLNELIGKRSIMNLKKDRLIAWEDVG